MGESVRRTGLTAADISVWSERMNKRYASPLSTDYPFTRQPVTSQRIKALDDWAELAERASAIGLLPKGKLIVLKDVQVLFAYNPVIMEPYVSSVRFISPEFDVFVRRKPQSWEASVSPVDVHGKKIDETQAYKKFDSRFDQMKIDYDRLLKQAMRTREEELQRLSDIADRFSKYPQGRSY